MIVFVSYSSKNRKRIEDLVLQLGQLGHDVQFESKIIGGDVSWQQVMDTIVTADLFVATLSAETLDSYSAHLENEYAINLDKYILFVALDDLSTLTSLDPHLRAKAVDFSEHNPSANDVLAAAINSIASLEPRKRVAAPVPDWEAALTNLRQRMSAVRADLAEQGAILLNLREFLERHETFQASRNLLANFASRGDLHPEIKQQARRLLGQARHVGSLLQKIQQRGIFYGAIILSLMISLAVVLLSQVVLQFRAQRGSMLRLTSTALTLQAITATFTQVQTEVPSVLTSAPILTMTEASASRILASPTAEASLIASTATPTITATEILLATNTPRSVTATAVAQVPTVTASSTSISPTMRSTVTPIPTQTLPVPTNQPPTGVPKESAASAPTKGSSSISSLESRITRNLYVGFAVQDSIFGLRVTSVGAAAKSAGVKEGDYVLAVGTKLVRSSFELLKLMQTQTTSSSHILRIRRGRQIVNVPIVIAERDFTLSYPNQTEILK